MQPSSSTELSSRGSTPVSSFNVAKREPYTRAQGNTAEYCDLVSSSRGNAQTGDKERKNRLEKYYLLAITPRPSFLIPPDGFLMNLAGHIGFFINSVPRIFNLMITVSP